MSAAAMATGSSRSSTPFPAGQQLPLLVSMACSGLGPAVATIVSNPLEVCKTRLQFSGEHGGPRLYAGPIDCIVKTWRVEGMRGLQAGLGPAVVREGSKTFFRYGLYAPILTQLHQDESTAAPISKRMVAGAAAGAIAATVCNPLDLLKCQLQASGQSGARNYEYKTGIAAMRQIVESSPRGVLALWVGTTVSIPRSMVSTSVMMTTQTYLKEHAIAGGLSTWFSTAVSSLGAAACTIFAQAPLDIVRARQFSPEMSRSLGAQGQKGPVAIAIGMVRNEGVFSFWSGAGVNFIRYAPHAVLSFWLIDAFKARAVEIYTKS